MGDQLATCGFSPSSFHTLNNVEMVENVVEATVFGQPIQQFPHFLLRSIHGSQCTTRGKAVAADVPPPSVALGASNAMAFSGGAQAPSAATPGQRLDTRPSPAENSPVVCLE